MSFDIASDAASAPNSPKPRRIDLHCHSEASNKAAEVMLNAIHCPECYSAPADVHAQARRRGMDFVTITDHDTIDGALTLADRSDVIVGEELTCWFPEDRCKMHVLVWGIDAVHHAALQSRAADIYEVALYIEEHRIAHAVAHPIYRQNDKLERWHLERLILMFKGFECLNGAHSPLHREAFEPVLDRLNRAELEKLSARHGLAPRWPEPWIKSRTAGSDDHGLLNIGRTWTEFPEYVSNVQQVLECIRVGASRPGGEAGSSSKLAHTFYSVAVRYYSRHILAPVGTPNLTTTILQTLVGERPAPKKSELAGHFLKYKARKIWTRVSRPFTRKPPEPAHGTGLLKQLFLASSAARLSEHPALKSALAQGLPPLGEHEDIFRFVSSVNRDVSEGIACAISKSIDDASFTGLFDSISAVLAQQFVLLPYYFAVFHQNKERKLLHEITGTPRKFDPATIKVGLFTDTLDDINGVARFIRDMGEEARKLERNLIIHTSSAQDPPIAMGGLSGLSGSSFDRKNFIPLLTRPLPYYPELKLNLPPVLEILEWADRQQFDAIHVSTPGPMGLCGWAVAKMLRVPLLGTYHTDFPAYIDQLTRDHRITNGAIGYMKWFYGQMAGVFSRSRSYRFKLNDLDISEERLLNVSPGINTTKFNPAHRDPALWDVMGVREPRRLLYCGRVSVEKNLPLLVEAFKQLCRMRNDVALVIAGDGPYRNAMREVLNGLPAYFLGYQDDAQLGPVYASSDLFVFPSRTDTLGQVVMEAQASGLPALVSNEGGPKETIDDGITGTVLDGVDAGRWCRAIDELLNDEPRRMRMSRGAIHRAARWSLQNTFEAFWAEHARALEPVSTSADEAAASPVGRIHV